MEGFLLLEVVVAMGVLAVAVLPVARTLAVGVERVGRGSRLRAAMEVMGRVESGGVPVAEDWQRAGATPEGVPCWARATAVAAPEVDWRWLEVVCTLRAPGHAGPVDPLARSVRMLLAEAGEEEG